MNHDENSNKLSTTTEGRDYGIVIPCDADQFGAFISSLLGKPQAIETLINGAFKIDKNDILNTHLLIEQRLKQQNEASLVQFTAAIFYNDDSSVLLNSLHDFLHYTEVKPIVSTRLIINWSYLIKFKNKATPEKQEISLSFNTSPNPFRFMSSYLLANHFRNYRGDIMININHTERTWGGDIESLVSGHLKNLTLPSSGLRKWITKHSEKIGVTAGFFFYLGSIYTILTIFSRLAEIKKLELKKLSQLNIESKLDSIIELIRLTTWSTPTAVACLLFIVSGLAAVIFGSFVGNKANLSRKSHILLSKAAIDQKEITDKKENRDWYLFWVSAASSILVGISSNFIFTKIFL